MENAIIEKLTTIENLIRNQTDDVLTFQQAAEFLDVSKSYLYKLTSLNKIPCYKPAGKKLFFNKRELTENLTPKICTNRANFCLTQRRRDAKGTQRKKKNFAYLLRLCVFACALSLVGLRQSFAGWLLQNPVKTNTEIEQEADDYIVNGKKGGAE